MLRAIKLRAPVRTMPVQMLMPEAGRIITTVVKVIITAREIIAAAKGIN